MTALANDFENGTIGNSVATTDTGSGDQFDVVTIGASAVLAYDATHTYGVTAVKVSTPVTARTAAVAWVTALGTVTDHLGRIYIYLTANLTNNIQLVRTQSTNTLGCAILLGANGKLALLDSTGATVATSTNTVSLNQWVRIEFHFKHSTTVGQLELKLFNNPDSTTATETLTSGAALNTLASVNRILFGCCTSVANIGPFWFDNIMAGQATYPGPSITNIDSDTVSFLFTPSATEAYAKTDADTELFSLTPVDADIAAFVETNTAAVILTPSASETAQYVDSGVESLLLTPSATEIEVAVDANTSVITLSGSSSDTAAYVDSNTVGVYITPSGDDSIVGVDSDNGLITLTPSATTEVASYEDSDTELFSLVPSSSDVADYIDESTVSLNLLPDSTDLLSGVDSDTLNLGLTPTYSDTAQLVDAEKEYLTLTPSGDDITSFIDSGVKYLVLTPSGSDTYTPATGFPTTDADQLNLKLTPSTQSEGIVTHDSDIVGIVFTISSSDVAAYVDHATERLRLTPSSIDTAQRVDSRTVPILLNPSASDKAAFVDKEQINVKFTISSVEGLITHDADTLDLALTASATDTAAFVDSATAQLLATPSSPVEGLVHADTEVAIITTVPLTEYEVIFRPYELLFKLTPFTVVEYQKLFAVILRGVLNQHYNAALRQHFAGDLQTNTYTGQLAPHWTNALSNRWASDWKGREFWTTLL